MNEYRSLFRGELRINDSGGINNVAGGGLTKTGTGTLLFTGLFDNYTGATTISAGTLAVSANAGDFDSSSDVFVAAGATLDISAYSGETAQAISGAGTINLGSTSLGIFGASGTYVFSGVIKDGGLSGGNGGSLIKYGNSTLTLSGNNTYTGGTTVNAGTLVAGNANAFGTGALTVTGGTLETTGAQVGSGPTFAIQAASYTQAAGATLALLADSRSNFDSIQLGNGMASLNGTLDLAFASGANPLAGQTYDIIGTTGSGSGNFSSIVLTGAGGLHATANFITGTGEVISLASVPTLYWTGSTTGTALADANGNWDTTGTNTVWSTANTGGTASVWSNATGGDIASFGAGGSSPVTVTIDQTGVTSSGITFNAMGTGGAYTIASGGAGDNLTLNGTITMNANATISAPIVGNGALTITGPDILTLSSINNTYTGGTTVNSGATLNVTGVITGALVDNGTFDVNDGFSITDLTGTGTINLATNFLGVNPTMADTFSGALTGTSNAVFQSSGTSGSMTLTGNLSGFAGYFETINGGTLTLNGTGPLNSSVILLPQNNSTLNVAYSNLNGNSVTFQGNTTAGFLNVTGTGPGTVGAIDIADTSGNTFNTIDAGGASNTLPLSGSITSAAGGNNTLILQNGIFDLTGTSSSSFAAGTLQIGNGTGTSVVQFAAATNLPATNVGITLNDGTLQYGAASLTVANNLTLTGNGAIDTNGFGDPSSGETYSGNITGSGNLTILSSVAGGEVYLTGNNSAFTGNTTLENGVEVGISTSTAFGNGIVSIGTGGGTVEYDAAVTVNNNLVLNNGVAIAGINMHGEAGTWAGAISGTNGLLVHDSLGGGTLTLTNANNSYSGATSIGLGNAVTLALAGSGSIANSSGVSIASGGTFDISGTTSGTSIVSLGGVSGSIVALGGQTLTITNAAMGANGTFGGVIGGTGGGLTLLAGTETLSGTNTYTGGTTINGGALSISSDSNLGAVAGAVTLGGGTLNYTGASGTLANAINVTGSSTSVLENSGSGMETLTGAISNPGNTLAFSGGTFNLNETGSGAGTFQIGDAPSTVIVSNPNAFGSGAILLTTGSTLETLGAFNGSGSTIAMTAGSYTQQAGSTLRLLATGNAIDSVQLGSGSASLNGTLDLIFSGFTPVQGQKYKVIDTTGSVTGNFSSIVLSGAPSLKGMGSFIPGIGEVIDLSYLAFFSNLSGFTPNQTAVANYLNTNAIGPNTPTVITNALNSISLLPASQQAAYLNEFTLQAYSQLPDQAIQNDTFLAQEVFGQVQDAFQYGGFNTSGLTLLKTSDQDPFAVSMDAAMQSAQQQANNSVSYLDAVATTPGAVPAAVPAVPARESYNRFSGFVIGTVTLDQLPQDGGATQHFTTGGILAGLDYRLNRHLLVGALFNYGYTGGTLDSVGSRQESSSYTPGLFAGYTQGGFYANGLMSYTYNSYKINRNINVPGSSSTATGKPDSNEYDVNALAGYYFPVAQGFKIGPAAGVGFTQVNTSGYSETGSPFGLSVAKQHADSLRSLVGMQGLYTFHPLNDPLPINLSFNAFWQHEFLNSARDMTASFTQLGGSSFIFNTAGPARNSALLGLGVNGYIAKQVSLFVNYESQIGTHSQFAQTVMAGVAVNF